MSLQAAEHPVQVEVNPEPPTVHDAMLASIARTAFSVNSDLIPYFPDSTLSDRQPPADCTTGTLTILGGDVVRVDSQPPQELALVASRQLLRTLIRSPGSKILEVVAYRQAQSAGTDPHERLATLRTAHEELVQLATEQDQPIVTTHTGERGETILDMSGVGVVDARRGRGYKDARFAYSVPLFLDFINKGGILPNMTEVVVLRAAKSALQQASDSRLSGKMVERFKLLNEIIASVQYTRTEDYVDKNPLQQSKAARGIRARLAETLSPSWQQQGVCRNKIGIQHLFFSTSYYERKYERDQRESQAKQHCQACPVREVCLETALSSGKVEGVWGGTTQQERNKILRKRQARAS